MVGSGGWMRGGVQGDRVSAGKMGTFWRWASSQPHSLKMGQGLGEGTHSFNPSPWEAEAGRALSQNKTQQQQQQQQQSHLAKAIYEWTSAKTTYRWPTGVCKRAPRHPLNIGKYKPDPWGTTSLRGESSIEEEGKDSSVGEGVENRDPWGDASEFSLRAIKYGVSSNHWTYSMIQQPC